MISTIKYNSYIIYYIRTRDSKNFQVYFLLYFLRSKTKTQTLKEHDFFIFKIGMKLLGGNSRGNNF